MHAREEQNRQRITRDSGQRFLRNDRHRAEHGMSSMSQYRRPLARRASGDRPMKQRLRHTIAPWHRILPIACDSRSWLLPSRLPRTSGLGQPMAHALRTCLIAISLGRALGLREGQLADTYYTTLLRFVGCTSDSHELMAFAAGEDVRFRQLMVAIGNDTPDEIAPHFAQFMAAVGAGGDIPARVQEALESPDGIGAQIAAVHCEVATMLAARLGLGPTVCDALRHAFERWDGRGFPEWTVWRRGACADSSRRRCPRYRGPHADARPRGDARRAPAAPRSCVRSACRRRVPQARCPHHGRHRGSRRVERSTCVANPVALEWVPAGRIDEALTAFADFADAKTPFTLGHSRGVAEFGEAAARNLGLSAADATCVRRAGLLHDIGVSGVPNAIWEWKGTLSVDQWERVRLHVYYTERILARCECLQPISTYCRGASRASRRLRLSPRQSRERPR